MSLHRGIQSAIFYYLSCAPCAEARYRKKRKQEAVRDRADRDALEEEMPNAYRHPEPSSTNPYWGEDIALGPALVARGGGNKKGKNGGRKSPREILSSNASMAGASSLDLPPKSMQRGDEFLWGSEGNLDGTAAPIQVPQRAARTRGKSNETSTTTASSYATTATYSNYRSPPVSDLLPPILRTVHSREEVVWMMQPPPVAEIMSGKRDGGGGPRSGASSRQTSTRMARTISRGSATTKGDHSPQSLPLDLRPTTSHDHPTANSSSSGGLVPIRRVASRPPLLSPIVSETHVSQTEDSLLTTIDSVQQNTAPARRKQRPRANSDPRKTPVMMQGRIFATANNRKNEGDVVLPSSSPDHWNVNGGGGEEDVLVVRPELFDSWYTPEFELDRWVHEHTKREGIRERWSMDL